MAIGYNDLQATKVIKCYKTKIHKSSLLLQNPLLYSHSRCLYAAEN